MRNVLEGTPLGEKQDCLATDRLQVRQRHPLQPQLLAKTDVHALYPLVPARSIAHYGRQEHLERQDGRF